MNKSSHQALPFSQADLDYLLSPRAIRERAEKLLEHALAGRTSFSVHLDRLDEVAALVVEVTRANYPDLRIPFHSRWGHFRAGAVDRVRELEEKLGSASRDERARAKLDLAIVSVLLDAGAGASWKYAERESGKIYDRSEGLAVASFRMFLEGAFSSDPRRPLQADARGLMALTEQKLAAGFQVSGDNPLVGVPGRVALLRELGRALTRDAERFGGGDSARPGALLDHYRARSRGGSLRASELLTGVLLGLGPIWPNRLKMGEVNLGDIWPHPLLGAAGTTAGLIPFHKLSQWLTYSLIEPLMEAGLDITDVNGLTGLAEYRNGGLLLDSGLIRLRDASAASRAHKPESELVIEWRALTVALLDRIAGKVRAALGKTEEEFPLAKVLEGGTWWAGRRIASRLRPGGPPPLLIDSDATVF